MGVKAIMQRAGAPWRRATWKRRHLVVLALAGAVVYGFLALRPEWSPMHRWNRAFGDASLLLVSFAMALGPAARLWAPWRALLPWRRELGVYGVFLALAHTVVILAGWVQWDLLRLFGYELVPALQRYVMLQNGFGLANAIGILALLYGLALAATSNDRSQRLLGGAVWKFVQQSAYVLWALILVHTAYFLFLHFQDFHRPLPPPNDLRWPLSLWVAVIALLQLCATVKTWRQKRGAEARRTPDRRWRDRPDALTQS